MDQPLSPVNNVSYMDRSTGGMHIPPNQTQMPEVSGMNSAELSGDAGYYSTSPSQLVYPTAPPSLHTTPNTPTSIPDIILTGERRDASGGGGGEVIIESWRFLDFSAADELSRQELSLTKQLEAELLSEESLREGLGPLDLDGLQMLSDPTINLISDGIEDNFRLDRS